jgi:hypothetical protein
MSEIFIAPSPAIAARQLGEEMVIMSAADSSLFTLSEVATAIWQAADGRTPLSEIIRQRVCAEFDIAPEEAFRDAEEFVRALASHGVLLISDQPIAADSPEPR